jgi:hypothetical protein
LRPIEYLVPDGACAAAENRENRPEKGRMKVADVRAALALPLHPLCPRGFFRLFLPLFWRATSVLSFIPFYFYQNRELDIST